MSEDDLFETLEADLALGDVSAELDAGASLPPTPEAIERRQKRVQELMSTPEGMALALLYLLGGAEALPQCNPDCTFCNRQSADEADCICGDEG